MCSSVLLLKERVLCIELSGVPFCSLSAIDLAFSIEAGPAVPLLSALFERMKDVAPGVTCRPRLCERVSAAGAGLFQASVLPCSLTRGFVLLTLGCALRPCTVGTFACALCVLGFVLVALGSDFWDELGDSPHACSVVCGLSWGGFASTFARGDGDARGWRSGVLEHGGKGEDERERSLVPGELLRAGDLLRAISAVLFLLDSVSPRKLTVAAALGVEDFVGGGSVEEFRGVEAAEGVLSPCI